MSEQVIHCWQPSTRLQALLAKKLNQETKIALELNDPLFADVFPDRLREKLCNRTGNTLMRATWQDEYFEKMTWSQFIEEARKPYSHSRLSTIRNLGRVSFDEINKALNHE